MPSPTFATAARRRDQEPPRIPELRRLARRGLSASTNDTSTAISSPSRSPSLKVTGKPLQRPTGALPFTNASRSTGSRSPSSLSRKPDPLASWNQIIVPFTRDSLLSTVGVARVTRRARLQTARPLRSRGRRHVVRLDALVALALLERDL